MRVLVSLLFCLLAACATAPAPAAGLNDVAEQYVRLSLEMGAHEEGYVDAYYGPPEWKTEAEAHPRSLPDLQQAASDLRNQAAAIGAHSQDPAVVRRAHALAGYLASAQFRIRMMQGERASFLDEAEGLFGLRPALHPLESYDGALARIDALTPGDGPLADRVDAFKARYAIPSDRLQAVMQAAIDECRARTRANIDLPADERFDMEIVTGQSWGAYNWYQGGNRSLIQINAGLPVPIDAALNYGCHEGYPGHHVQGIYAERLYRERGWAEYSVAPLYSPQGPLNEGGGNYGLDLAFPGDERARFERAVLYPLAGLDPASAPAYEALLEEQRHLAGAQLTIAEMLLDGEIDRPRAVALLQHYGPMTQARADRLIAFTEHYRSYVINYQTGQDVVRAYVEREAATPQARWRVYEDMIGEPTLAEDLQ
ncbi:MAG: hypothetical protein R3C25_11305 [Hyphomonadaceae bacterium]